MPAAIAAETVAAAAAVSLGAGGLFDADAARDMARKVENEFYKER